MQTDWNGPADVVIVGGGVIGLSLALELLRRERRVLLLERDRPGAGATFAAGGMLAPISEAELEPAELIELGRDSLNRYPQFVADVERLGGFGCGYRDEGTLWVATNRDDREELGRLEETMRLKSLEVQPLTPEQVGRLEPHLSGRVLGGLRVGTDHQIDPRKLTLGLRRAVEALGGRILCPARVESIEAQAGRVTGVSGRGPNEERLDVRAARVILAAGAWSTDGIRQPAGSFGLRPIKGQLIRLNGPRLIEHVVRAPDVYLIPRSDGALLVGATMEETGHDNSATAGAVLDLLRHAWQVLPGIYDLQFEEVSVGLRSAVADHLPVIGPSAVENLYLAFGHFRNGILLAPATAHYLADWIMQGRMPDALRSFQAERLAGRGAADPNEEREWTQA